MEILQFPNDNLRVKAKSVEKVTDELVNTAKQMYETMKKVQGLGIASTQVGLDMALLVLENNGAMLAMFNPVIMKRSQKQEYDQEGCLSFIGKFRRIKRPVEVTAKYRDVNNKMQYRVFTGIQARALVHEFDHLQGKLYIDYDEETDKS